MPLTRQQLYLLLRGAGLPKGIGGVAAQTAATSPLVHQQATQIAGQNKQRASLLAGAIQAGTLQPKQLSPQDLDLVRPALKGTGTGGFLSDVGDVLGNLGSDIEDAGKGIVPGFVNTLSAGIHDVTGLAGYHPKPIISLGKSGFTGPHEPSQVKSEVIDPLVNQYKYMYGGVGAPPGSTFRGRLAAHPLQPILDAATVASLGSGGAIKGATALSRAGVDNSLVDTLVRAGSTEGRAPVILNPGQQERAGVSFPQINRRYSSRPLMKAGQVAWDKLADNVGPVGDFNTNRVTKRLQRTEYGKGLAAESASVRAAVTPLVGSRRDLSTAEATALDYALRGWNTPEKIQAARSMFQDSLNGSLPEGWNIGDFEGMFKTPEDARRFVQYKANLPADVENLILNPTPAMINAAQATHEAVQEGFGKMGLTDEEMQHRIGESDRVLEDYQNGRLGQPRDEEPPPIPPDQGTPVEPDPNGPGGGFYDPSQARDGAGNPLPPEHLDHIARVKDEEAQAMFGRGWHDLTAEEQQAVLDGMWNKAEEPQQGMQDFTGSMWDEWAKEPPASPEVLDQIARDSFGADSWDALTDSEKQTIKDYLEQQKQHEGNTIGDLDPAAGDAMNAERDSWEGPPTDPGPISDYIWQLNEELGKPLDFDDFGGTPDALYEDFKTNPPQSHEEALQRFQEFADDPQALYDKHFSDSPDLGDVVRGLNDQANVPEIPNTPEGLLSQIGDHMEGDQPPEWYDQRARESAAMEEFGKTWDQLTPEEQAQAEQNIIGLSDHQMPDNPWEDFNKTQTPPEEPTVAGANYDDIQGLIGQYHDMPRIEQSLIETADELHQEFGEITDWTDEDADNAIQHVMERFGVHPDHINQIYEDLQDGSVNDTETFVEKVIGFDPDHPGQGRWGKVPEHPTFPDQFPADESSVPGNPPPSIEDAVRGLTEKGQSIRDEGNTPNPLQDLWDRLLEGKTPEEIQAMQDKANELGPEGVLDWMRSIPIHTGMDPRTIGDLANHFEDQFGDLDNFWENHHDDHGMDVVRQIIKAYHPEDNPHQGRVGFISDDTYGPDVGDYESWSEYIANVAAAYDDMRTQDNITGWTGGTPGQGDPITEKPDIPENRQPPNVPPPEPGSWEHQSPHSEAAYQHFSSKYPTPMDFLTHADQVEKDQFIAEFIKDERSGDLSTPYEEMGRVDPTQLPDEAWSQLRQATTDATPEDLKSWEAPSEWDPEGDPGSYTTWEGYVGWVGDQVHDVLKDGGWLFGDLPWTGWMRDAREAGLRQRMDEGGIPNVPNVPPPTDFAPPPPSGHPIEPTYVPNLPAAGFQAQEPGRLAKMFGTPDETTFGRGKRQRNTSAMGVTAQNMFAGRPEAALRERPEVLASGAARMDPSHFVESVARREKELVAQGFNADLLNKLSAKDETGDPLKFQNQEEVYKRLGDKWVLVNEQFPINWFSAETKFADETVQTLESLRQQGLSQHDPQVEQIISQIADAHARDFVKQAFSAQKLDGVAIPRHFYDYQKRLVTAMDPFDNGVGRVYARYMHRWRAFTLAYMPRWAVNTAVGSFFLNMVKGVSPRDYMLARDMTKRGMFGEPRLGGVELGGLTGMEYLEPSAMGHLERSTGVRMTPMGERIVEKVQQIEDHFRKASFVHSLDKVSQRRLGDMGQVLSNLERRRSTFYDTRQPWNPHSDEEVLQRMLDNPDAVSEAIDDLNSFAYNFAALGPYERRYVRMAVPFWGWYKFISKVAYRLPVEYPGRANVLANLGMLGMQQEDSKLGPRPDWLRGIVPLGLSQKGPLHYLSTLGQNPFGQFFNPLGPHGGVEGAITLGQASPPIQALLSAFGLDSLRGGEVPISPQQGVAPDYFGSLIDVKNGRETDAGQQAGLRRLVMGLLRSAPQFRMGEQWLAGGRSVYPESIPFFDQRAMPTDPRDTSLLANLGQIFGVAPKSYDLHGYQKGIKKRVKYAKARNKTSLKRIRKSDKDIKKK